MQSPNLKVSYGLAYSSQGIEGANAAMLAATPDASSLATKGLAAVIADSSGRNLMAHQAAKISAKGFIVDYYSTPDTWDVKTSALKVLQALNNWLFAQNKLLPNGSYINSMSSLVLLANQAHLFHVGDTLIYLLRGGDCQQLNQEHTTFLGGYRYPSRAMGMNPNLDMDYLNLNLKQGDIFLFTTQAVKGTLSASDLVAVVSRFAEDLNLACQEILNTALAKSSARGYSNPNFCFQLLRVDQLPKKADPLNPTEPSLPVPVELQLGNQLDGYKVVEVLERSALNRTYKVVAQTTLKPFILKTLSPLIAQRPKYLTQFRMQQWLLSKVSSPYIAKLEPFISPPSHLYYLMEFIPSLSLAQWQAKNPNADFQVKIDLIEQLTKAVRALHRREVLHQGLNPQQIRVTPQGLIKLVDFSASGLLKTQGLPPLTHLARRAGLSVYSAPEYSLGQPPSERSDLYSLAAIAYELLTGQPPYAGKLAHLNSKADLAKINYVPALSLNTNLPEWIDWPLRKALQPDPELRYRRLSEFIYDLKKPNFSQFLPSQPQKSFNVWKLVAAVFLLLLILNWFFHPSSF